MRGIKIGEKIIRVRATPLALLYYKQTFGTDLVSDMVSMQGIEKDPSRFDSIVLLQMMWAMAKADAGPGSKFPGFETWLSDLEGLDFSDPGMMQTVMEEAADGFFRRGIQEQQKQRKN